MSRRIDIELTSTRDDGSWTWRAAGAREPKGTLDGAILPAGASVGDVLKAETEGYLDGLEVVAIVPPRAPRREPERLELRTPRRDDTPLVTTDVRRRSSSERGRRPDRRRGRDGRDDGRRDRDGERRGRDRDRDRDRQSARHERDRSDRPGRGDRAGRPAGGRAAAAAAEAKPKPKRLRPARTHRAALLEALPGEQRPIAEQLLQGGIPAVRQAIDKQNQSLKAEGKPEVNRDALLKVAEDIRPRALAALWRDRAEAAVASIDDLDLRDLRSVVNAAGDAGRDEEARALAAQLREALANRVEKEHAAWLAELSDMLRDGRVVRALRLSSRPPKAGAPIPADLTNELAEAASQALTDETGQDRWVTVLDALAYSPVRRRVIPQSLPSKLSPNLRETIARLGTRLPEIAHIFDIEPDESAGRAGSPTRPARRRGGGGRGSDAARGGGGGGGGGGRRGPRGQSPSQSRPQAPSVRSAPAPAGSAPGAEAPADAASPAEAPASPEAESSASGEPARSSSAEAPASPESESSAQAADPAGSGSAEAPASPDSGSTQDAAGEAAGEAPATGAGAGSDAEVPAAAEPEAPAPEGAADQPESSASAGEPSGSGSAEVPAAAEPEAPAPESGGEPAPSDGGSAPSENGTAAASEPSEPEPGGESVVVGAPAEAAEASPSAAPDEDGGQRTSPVIEAGTMPGDDAAGD